MMTNTGDVPYPNKIDRYWGTESLFIASCQLTSDLVCPFVEPICEWNLFFVVPGQKANLDAVTKLRPRHQSKLDGVP